MHFSKSAAGWTIGAVGLICIIGNLWVTILRSTIPRARDDVVVGKEIGREKHPGEDDVYWLVLEQAGRLHVDGEVWEGVEEGDRIEKNAWSRELHVDDARIIPLALSEDAWGMIWVMAGSVVVIVLFGWSTTRFDSAKRGRDGKQ